MRRGETIVVRADFSMMSVEWYYASFQGITPEFAKLSGENGYWFGARVAGINEVSSFGGYDLRVGDIIVQINGVPFRTADDYFRMLWLIRPEVATAYTIVRDSTPFELVVRHLPRTYDNLAGWLMSHPEEYLRQR
jgi:S1-C subfamily serine protease